MPNNGYALEINNLTCRYGDFTAVSNLSFQVERGEIFGFLGPNGAGKTTIIRTILDFIRADNGSAKVFGLDSQTESVAIKRQIGYLPAELQLWIR